MKKIIKKIVLSITFIILMIGISKVAPIVLRGYQMYKTVINQTSIKDSVNKVRSDKDYITIDNISDEYISHVLRSEDRRFYFHFGFDFISTGRAVYNDLKAGSFIQGGSTITQQLAKNLYFDFDKKYERKVAELFVAFDLEKEYTKDEILELYCNITYFGENCYGIKEAANHYYGIDQKNLTKSQAGALVFTLKSPNNYNPHVYHKQTNKKVAAR